MSPPETPPGHDVTTSPAHQVSLNPVDPANLIDPGPMFRVLRETAPVFWSEHIQAWVVTRHADVTNCFRDSRLSANRVLFLETQLRYAGLGRQDVPEYIDFISKQMAVKDGAEHLRIRRQVSMSFSPMDLDKTLPSIRRTVHFLLDRVQEQGHMELVSDLAYQLAPFVIADFLGVPPESQDRFQKASDPIINFGSPSTGLDMKQMGFNANQATKDFSDFMSKLFEERRIQPRADAISQLVERSAGGQMTHDELIANASFILFGGHLTTTDQLANGVHTLLTHPNQLQKLQQNPTLIRSAIEEILRFQTAVPYTHRIVTEDLQLHGKSLRKGDIVFLSMASANRDPSVFPDADVFDITRDYTRQKHISFSFGPHHCIGAGLARRQLEVAFELLIQRMPNLRLDETKPARIKCYTMLARGMESMHVRW